MAGSATRQNSQTDYSGIAAEDLATDSIDLKVICHELTPAALSGTIAAGITTSNVTLKNRDGQAINSTATTANHIVATWEGKSNSKYPPLVRKGEPVKVYKIADQDKFYWTTTGRGRDSRTTDRIHLEIAATDPTKPGQSKDDTNTYTAYADSDKKVVGFKTSKANGEAMALTCHADLAAGTFILTDDSASPGNRIFLDTGTKSGTPQLQMNLTTGITFKMNGKDLLIRVPGKFLMQSDDRIVLDSPLIVLNTTAKGNVFINATNFAISAATDVIIKAGNVFGISAVASKVVGFFAAGASRFTSASMGPVASAYNPVTISDPLTGNAVTVSNSADTTTGTPYANP